MRQRDAASRLVERAVEMLVEDPGVLLDNGLRGEDVCELAGVSQTTFYRHFNKHSFIDAVVKVLVPEKFEISPAVLAEVAQVVAAGAGDPLSQIRAMATREFESARRDPMAARRLLAATMGKSHTQTLNNLRQQYRGADVTRAGLVRSLFEAWGASTRAPLTVDLMATTINALLEGLAMRWRIDPEAVPDWLFGEVSLAIVVAALDFEQRHEHLDDAAADLAIAIVNSRRLVQDGGLPEDPRGKIVNATREEFGQRGYFGATMDGIAARAGVSPQVVKRLFPSTGHIIRHALSHHYSKLAEGIADDSAIGHTEREIIERHLLRTAQLIAHEWSFMDALMSVNSHGERGGAASQIAPLDFAEILVPTIQQGQARGFFVDNYPAHDLAALLTDALTHRCLTRRDATPAENSQFVGVVLSGIEKPR